MADSRKHETDLTSVMRAIQGNAGRFVKGDLNG